MANLSRKKVYKRILKQLKHYKFMLALTIFFALITVAGNLIVPVFFGQVIDLFDLTKYSQVDFTQVFQKFIIIGAVVAATCVSQWLTSIINNRITYNVVKDVREEAFANLQKLPLSFIDSHSYGDIVGRNIADVDQFADGL